MSKLFQRLGIGGADEILVLNEPEGFCKELDELDGILVRESVIRTSEIDFALIFVTDPEQIAKRIDTVYPKLVGDAVVWYAFPSDASKTQITAEYPWEILGDYNLELIDMMPINKDWTGMHFRKNEYIDS